MRLASTQSNRGGQTYLSSDNYAGAHEQPTRKVSSTVISETLLGDHQQQQDSVRYVEIPVVQEVIVPVPRKEVVEVERRVPKIEIQYVDKTVDVPQIEYYDRVEEFPQVQEDIKYVHKTTTVDVPKEVIEHVPVYENKIIEQFVDVPGNVVEVPKPYQVTKEIPMPNYIREEFPVVVAQSLHPRFVVGRDCHVVETQEYAPQLVEVEIQVPKIVDLPVKARGVVDAWHRRVDVPDAQFNSIMRWLNPHLNLDDSAVAQQLPFRRNGPTIPQLSGPPCWAELPQNVTLLQKTPDTAMLQKEIYNFQNATGTLNYRGHTSEWDRSGMRIPTNISQPINYGQAPPPSFVLTGSQPVSYPRYQSSALVSQAHLVTHKAHPSISPAARSIIPLFETPLQSERGSSKHHRSSRKHRSR